MAQSILKNEIQIKDVEGEIEFPLLEINLKKIYENTKYVVDLCNQHNISVSGVVKVVQSMPQVVNEMDKAGCKYLATSRLNQVIDMKNQGVTKPIMLIRLPMFNEISELVRYADISLNSEKETLTRINKECRLQGKKHKVVLMVDLGDLREGVMDEEELIQLALYVENELECVELYGIGTNLGCFGSIKPTEDNLGKLCNIAERIEDLIHRELDMISGGATSSLTLLWDGKMPSKINNLRIGEGILVAKDLDVFWKYDMSMLHQDAFVLKAQVVEVKSKPSHPVGERFIDAFGNVPTYEDRGTRKRALLAIGKQDFVSIDTLVPVDDGIELIGGSSDHLIIDIENSKEDYNVGDVLEFGIFYPHLLYLIGSNDVKKKFII
ncbi:MAG: alanine/ornithine racemase family PLP-dependent enzyme [Clostridium sp.]|uniref:alanine/ornithine racemase family PLP-dependent enzyme n=1 Tax=Clostridium sp. TaxID=1506 RepID=UPI003029E787